MKTQASNSWCDSNLSHQFGSICKDGESAYPERYLGVRLSMLPPIFMNIKEKLQKLIELYEQDIVHFQSGGYYFQECEYECDQAKARELEIVVADLKAIVETI